MYATRRKCVALGMPQFGSEPKFEPELFRTGPRFGPRFGKSAEPDHKSGSTFGQGRIFENFCWTQFKPNFLWTLDQRSISFLLFLKFIPFHFLLVNGFPGFISITITSEVCCLDYVTQIVTLVTSKATTVLSYIIYCHQPLHQVRLHF